MHVAVTGANGFVGRHVLQALADAGCDRVTAISRTDPGPWLPDGTMHVHADLSAAQPDLFERLGAPDALIHLAWGGLPNYSSRAHFEVELPLHYAFLKHAIDHGLRSLLCAGTCLEYGTGDGALDETRVPAPHNAYAFAKDSLRRQLSFLRDDTPFDFTWARLFYMYGHGQSGSSLYGQFAASVERGQTEFAMSGGEQLRDYLSVQEVARHLAALALRAPDAGIVNICAGTPISVRSLVERWARERSWNGELLLGQYPYPPHEPMAFWGINDKLRRLTEHSR